MSQQSFTIFDTALGPCGIAWGEHGLVGMQLPEEDAAATRSRIARRFPGGEEAEPPPDVRAVIDAVVALIRGEATPDFADAALDMRRVEPFDRDVYAIARAVRPGATISYGEIAERLGEPGAARAVGVAMAKNPFPIVVPCHRVLAAGGRIGGFSANGGIATKRKLLAIESVHAKGDAAEPTLFDGV